MSLINPFTTLLGNSADDKLVIFFLFFPANRICLFMQIVSDDGDNLHEMTNPVSNRDNLHERQILFSGENKINISKCHVLKILPRELAFKNYIMGAQVRGSLPNIHKEEKV